MHLSSQTSERAATLSLLNCRTRTSRGTRDQVLVPGLATMAMGDTNAVAYGQTSHLAVILRTTSLRLYFVSLQGRPPRAGQVVAGLLIDDFILLDPVPKIPPRLDFEPGESESCEKSSKAIRPPGFPDTRAKPCHVPVLVSSGVVSLMARGSGLAAFLIEVIRGGVTSVGMLESRSDFRQPGFGAAASQAASLIVG